MRTQACHQAFSRLTDAAMDTLIMLRQRPEEDAWLRAKRVTEANLNHRAMDLHNGLFDSIERFANSSRFEILTQPFFDGAHRALSVQLALRSEELAVPFEQACRRLSTPLQVELATRSLTSSLSNLFAIAYSEQNSVYCGSHFTTLPPDIIDKHIVRLAHCYRALSHAWAKHPPETQTVFDLANILNRLSRDATNFKHFDSFRIAITQALAEGSPVFLKALQDENSKIQNGFCDILSNAHAMAESMEISPKNPANASPASRRRL